MTNLAEKPEVPIPFNYIPRSYQDPLFVAMNTGCKRAVEIWHRRAGKDKSMLNLMIEKMLQRVGTYYYFFPTYAQGKKIIWKGVDGDSFPFLSHFPEEMIATKNETDLSITFNNGSIFQIIGTDNIDSIVGTNPIGCVFSEYALQNPSAWDFIRPILRENGGWAIFNYTPRGENHGYAMYQMAKENPDWFCRKLTVNDTKRPDGTPVITPAMIQAERDEGMSEDMIQQEYYCSFGKGVLGAYFNKEMQRARKDGRICRVPYDTALLVDTYWDLGMNDQNVLWFVQQTGREIRLIDYYSANGEGLAHYAKVLKERDYLYGKHYLPHDGLVRELGTGVSRETTANTLGIKPTVIVPRVKEKSSSIEAARGLLSRCYFDIEKCKEGISALKNYTKEWDDKKKVFKNNPRHDWASNGADGFQTLALAHKDIVAKSKGQRVGQYQGEGAWMS